MTRLEAAHSIKKLTDQLVSKFHPDKIIIFKSWRLLCQQQAQMNH